MQQNWSFYTVLKNFKDYFLNPFFLWPYLT